MKKLITICAVVGLIMAVTGTAQADLDINAICINSCKDLLDGIPDTSNPWVFEVWVELDDPGSLHHIDVTKPGASTPFTTIYEVDGDWFYHSPSFYPSLGDLRADYPTGDYTFEFRDSGDILLDSVTLNYPDLDEPGDFAHITSPLHGATDVSLNPTFTWTIDSGAGDALDMGVEDPCTSEVFYESALVSMTTTSWAPGPLLPSHDYEFDVSVYNIKGWQPESGLPTMMTVEGDTFTCRLWIECGNDIRFTTVPECLFDMAGDLNDDCKVDFHDFAIMAANWLIDCDTNPSNPACVPK